MACVCVFEIVSPGVARSPGNGTVFGGKGSVSRVLLPNAGFQIPALWRKKAFWRHRSRFHLQGRPSPGCRHWRMSALNDDSAEYKGSTNYGPGKASYENLDYMHGEDARPAVEDLTVIHSPSSEPSMSFSIDQSGVKSASSYVAPIAFNNSQGHTRNEYLPNALRGNPEEVSYFSGSDTAVYLNSGDYETIKTPMVESNGSLFDAGQNNETYFIESEKPAYVSLVWEAGSKIEGVISDTRQEGIERKEESLSLIIGDDRRARKDETILHCFWIWSRDSASHFWARGQTLVNSLWSHNKMWKAFWKQALLGAQIPRHLFEAKEVWPDLGDATKGTVWLPREDDAFDIFFRNMSEIQNNILQMTAVQVKLAWIRVQQQYYRKIMQLEEILSTFPKSEEELNPREAELLAYTDRLVTQAKMNEAAYVSSQQALNTVEEMAFQLQTQVDELKEEVASRDRLLRLLKREGTLSLQSLQRAAQSLSDAEKKIVELESLVQIGEERLFKERDKLTGALKAAGHHEHALRVAELKVAELTTELTSLKESLGSGRGADKLSLQVKSLEHELRSRDRLLLEIKEETIRSTDALKLAAQIKQDLNATRQRELHLTQSLEAANEKVKELEEQLGRNIRATRAEEVLMQAQKMLREAKAEVDLLRQGVEVRDRAINIMKDEVDRNIALLGNAARDREELREMNHYVGELKMELESRDAKLSVMREEMALIINLAKKQQSIRPKLSSSKDVSSACTSSASLSSSVQESKPKRKTPVRKPRETGTSAPKPNGTRRTTRSPPQTSM